MDCDDVMLRLATRAARTLTGVEERTFHEHVSECADCQVLVGEGEDDDWRWISRVPVDAIASDDLTLPVVDPIVFRDPKELGAGGMGRVTRAFDRRLGREVAIKEILDHDLRPRFEREVSITAKLQHPSIVPIYEAGVFPDGSTFYTMRLVPGRSLADAIDEARTLEMRLRLMVHVRAAADALAYAHSRGVIHRDFKPGNVLVGEFGETVVIDWGLAKQDAAHDVPASRASAPQLTRVGSVLGTPCFMSPAQAAGAPADEADDVYALGAVLYNVLAGAPPYWDSSAHDADSLIAATQHLPPTPIAKLAPEAPADLHAIVERAMSRTRGERFTSVTQFVDELVRFEAGQLLKSRVYTLRELVIRWLRKHRIGVALATLSLVAAVVVGGLLLRLDRAASELAIKERGERLTHLYEDVARQAYIVDRDLLRLENALEGLTTAAAWALEGPEPIAPLYFDTDFADEQRRPTDFTKETKYRWPVSVSFPVMTVPAGVAREPLLPKFHRLSLLREHIRTMVVEAAAGDDVRPLPPAEADRVLLSRASPIDYAYVALPEGGFMMWPGMAALRQDYDVRTASFFQQSANRRGRHWGAPYIDSTVSENDDLVLPCTKAVWSRTGEFLGVAGVELTVTKLLDTSMKMTKRKPLRVSLVDDKGRRVLDSSLANQVFEANGRDEAIEFTPFELPDVAAAIRDQQEGILETKRDGRSIVVAFVRLDAIVPSWSYVVEVDAASLGN